MARSAAVRAFCMPSARRHVAILGKDVIRIGDAGVRSRELRVDGDGLLKAVDALAQRRLGLPVHDVAPANVVVLSLWIRLLNLAAVVVRPQLPTAAKPAKVRRTAVVITWRSACFAAQRVP